MFENTEQAGEDLKRQINLMTSLLQPIIRRPTIIKFEVIFDNNYQRKLAILVRVYNDFGLAKNDTTKLFWINAKNGDLIREHVKVGP